MCYLNFLCPSHPRCQVGVEHHNVGRSSLGSCLKMRNGPAAAQRNGVLIIGIHVIKVVF